MDKTIAPEERPRVSYLSVISFVLSPLGIIWYLMYFFINSLGIVDQDKKAYFIAAAILLLLIPFISGIVDLSKGNRRKTLSMLAVVISAIPLFIFIIATIFVTLILK